MPTRLVIPPGGFAGFAQQTPATQALFARAGRRGGLTTQRRRRRTKLASSKRRRKSAAGARGRRSRARLVKGSAQAKRFMARLRKMRRRKRG